MLNEGNRHDLEVLQAVVTGSSTNFWTSRDTRQRPRWVRVTRHASSCDTSRSPVGDTAQACDTSHLICRRGAGQPGVEGVRGECRGPQSGPRCSTSTARKVLVERVDGPPPGTGSAALRDRPARRRSRACKVESLDGPRVKA
jgi:hypothetical protein